MPPTPGLFNGQLYTKYTTENEHTKNDSEDERIHIICILSKRLLKDNFKKKNTEDLKQNTWMTDSVPSSQILLAMS